VEVVRRAQVAGAVASERNPVLEAKALVALAIGLGLGLHKYVF